MTNHADSIINRPFYSLTLDTPQGTETFAADTLTGVVSLGFTVARAHDIAVPERAAAADEHDDRHVATLTVRSHDSLLAKGLPVIVAEGIHLLVAFRQHPLVVAAHQRGVAESLRRSA